MPSGLQALLMNDHRRLSPPRARAARRGLGVGLAAAALAVACPPPSPPSGGERQASAAAAAASAGAASAGEPLHLGDRGYFKARGLDVMAFSDFYPEGHQGGISVIQNGVRTAANGDLRLEPAPGQWQAVPKLVDRKVDEEAQRISTRLRFPDDRKNGKGFNPIAYPDLELEYEVVLRAEGDAAIVEVNLDRPLPAAWVGRVGFNLELFPGEYFGRGFLMNGKPGGFPRQLVGPVARDEQGRVQAAPLARGLHLTVSPEHEPTRLQIESLAGGELILLDGRAEHDNGWFIVRSLLPADASTGALRWRLSPSAVPGFLRKPALQLSQVGYHPRARKVAVIELDRNDTERLPAALYRVGQGGQRTVALEGPAAEWGPFLRYDYLQFDFSAITEPGLYQLRYGAQWSSPFVIARDALSRGVWQPTLEYFLPVQMCHVRVNDRYRVWHDHCHRDDARMAPTGLNHFDGYVQGERTLTPFASGQPVAGLDRGGWHDAGDYDLRIESQIRTVRLLAQIHEAFAPDYDSTTVDRERAVVELHRPDGEPDVLQQLEHGVLSVLGGFESMGRLYRGIIAPTHRQYVLLGDAAAQTDGRRLQEGQTEAGARAGQKRPEASGQATVWPRPTARRNAPAADDRWVFTEDNPQRELEAAAGLAAASRALRSFRPELSRRCLSASRELLARRSTEALTQRIEALAELYLTTREPALLRELLSMRDLLLSNVESVGWVVGRLVPFIDDPAFHRALRKALVAFRRKLDAQAAATPFGVPYEPNIWGAGWGIQKFGVPQYFLSAAWPDLFDATYLLSAMNFVLGTHPGDNTASFVSGVGAQSLTVAYGVNRADRSYIPGGVGSGTALIQPDFPELKTWPFFWQQSEYVMGGGGTNFMFLVLAAEQLLARPRAAPLPP